jgi:hypothetical protein
MSWFMQSSAEALTKSMSKASTGPMTSAAQDLAVLGLLPIGPPSRFGSLFARFVEVEPQGEKGPWESVHLLLM